MSVVSSSPAQSTDQSTVETAPNPLLIGQGLPPFGDIQSSHVVPGIEQLLQNLGHDLEVLEAQLGQKLNAEPAVSITWADLIDTLSAITEKLGWSRGNIGHLMGV